MRTAVPERLVPLAFGLLLAVACPGRAAGPYPVVDTGQTACYNATSGIPCPAAGQPFYGQDAQAQGHPPRYGVSADGLTVFDETTGLTWQRSPDTNGDGSITKSDKLSLSQAQARPAALNAAAHGGFTDWRLPTIKELYSLIDFRGTDPSGYGGTDTSVLTPFIDTTAFQFAYGQTSAGERIIDSQYASSSVCVFNPSDNGATKLFGVNFADGRIKGYDLTMPDGSTKTFFVQCVRGNTSYGANSFVDNGDQTVTDTATGLTWAKADSGSAMSWQDALAWVQARNAANHLGHADWRLPNAKELQGLLDYTRSPDTTGSAAIDPVFSVTSITNEAGRTDYPWYWASTTHAAYNGSGASGVYLCFGRCGGWQKATPSATCYTLYDVHGAGAQRGDPKTAAGRSVIGTACTGGTAYGLGPQGDVQRGVNFVRLVRDAFAPGLHTVPPCRLFDTRESSGASAAAPALAAGESRRLDPTGRCGIPAGATALSVNAAVTSPQADGHLTLYRADATSAPLASTLNFRAGQTRANNGLLRTAVDGTGIRVANGSAGALHVVVDVNGYFP